MKAFNRGIAKSFMLVALLIGASITSKYSY